MTQIRTRRRGLGKIAPVAKPRGRGGYPASAVSGENERVRRFRAAAGTLLFLVVAPGVVAGLVPWLLTGWHATRVAVWLQVVGWVVVAVGAAVLLEAFARFVVEGAGTPAPAAPTEQLVVGGLYRYVRNPMYLAVAAVIAGQALVLGRWLLVGYGVVFGLAVWSFVHWYEEPTLRRQFGSAYDGYRATVPGWWPRRPRSRASNRHVS
jgi:protein-S-isoprenylcysteine O-methyltransferase Ste14